MAQLPDVARPRVGLQQFHRLALDLHPGPAERRAFVAQDTHDHVGDVVALAQGRQPEHGTAEPVVQIFAKAAGANQFVQRLVGGANDVQPHQRRLVGTQRQHLALGQHAQQAALQQHGHVADLVEEQRAAIGLQDLALRAAALGTGESAVAIAEQLALDQALGNGRAIQRHELLGAAFAVGVQRLCEGVFAGTGFAEQHHRNVAVGELAGLGDDVLQALVTDGEVAEGVWHHGAGRCCGCGGQWLMCHRLRPCRCPKHAVNQAAGGRHAQRQRQARRGVRIGPQVVDAAAEQVFDRGRHAQVQGPQEVLFRGPVRASQHAAFVESEQPVAVG